LCGINFSSIPVDFLAEKEKLLSRGERRFGRYFGIPKLMMILCIGMGVTYVPFVTSSFASIADGGGNCGCAGLNRHRRKE